MVGVFGPLDQRELLLHGRRSLGVAPKCQESNENEQPLSCRHIPLLTGAGWRSCQVIRQALWGEHFIEWRNRLLRLATRPPLSQLDRYNLRSPSFACRVERFRSRHGDLVSRLTGSVRPWRGEPRSGRGQPGRLPSRQRLSSQNALDPVQPLSPPGGVTQRHASASSPAGLQKQSSVFVVCEDIHEHVSIEPQRGPVYGWKAGSGRGRGVDGRQPVGLRPAGFAAIRWAQACGRDPRTEPARVHRRGHGGPRRRRAPLPRSRRPGSSGSSPAAVRG